MMYLWFKALHLIFMVTWFAGLFYLPRLFVYHAMTTDETGYARFCIMERKLFFGIMTPGAVLTLIFGIGMLVDGGWQNYHAMGWLHFKLALIGLLIAYHVWCGKLLLDFKHQRNRHTHIWYRWFNEVPTLVLIGVVILAVIKPF